MSPAQWIAHYGEASAQRAAADNAALRAAAAAQLAALAALPSGSRVLCHSDLHPLNLVDCAATLDSRGALVLLDWEYAHASDPLWDLAGWSANTDLERELQQDLLAQYLGRAPAPDEQLRLRRLAWLYDYVCLLWSELYLNLHGAGKAGTAEEGVAARARLLAARLMHPSSRSD
jgi:thiamine kinase-like enzyme